MSESDEDCAVVLDIGSGVTRAGFAGDDAPRCVLSSIVGHQRENNRKLFADGCFKDFYAGDEAQKHRGFLSLNYPVDRGVVTDWNDMETFLHHLFYDELYTSTRSPEDYNVLVTEPPLNPKHNTEKMAQVLFEKFEVPNFYSSNQGLLSCYASGRVSALMLEIGDSVSHIVPVYEGCCPQHAIRRFDFGGKDLTLYLQSLLNNQGYNFVTTADFEIVREIKELMCFASENYEQDIFKADCYGSLFKPYTLPDGNEIILNKERFQCPEQLFSSSPDIGFEGIHKMVFDSISSMDMDMRRDCNVNLIVSGGTTMLPGFPERLKREMGSLFSTSLVKVVAPPERKYSVWIGGSILASLSTFQNMWVSRQDYEEYGPDIVNRKCY